MANEKKTYDLDVDVVFHALARMDLAGEVDGFAARCRAAGLKLTATRELVGEAKKLLATLPAPKVAGPDCPGCDDPDDQ